jgi:hypothetical protein
MLRGEPFEMEHGRPPVEDPGCGSRFFRVPVQSGVRPGG